MPEIGEIVDVDPFSAAPAPSPGGGPQIGDVVDYDPFAPQTNIWGEIAEVGRGIPAGAVQAAGTALRGIAANQPTQRFANYLDQIEHGVLYRTREREGRVPVTDDTAYTDILQRIADDPGMFQSQQLWLRHAIEGVRSGNLDALAEARSKLPPAAVQKRELWRAGEAVSEFAEEHFPAKPGYEDSLGRAIGEGLGSLGAGLTFGVIPGVGSGLATTFFTAMGSGEAADRAVAEGATDEQIIEAAGLGAGAGATDILPAEMLLGRIPGGKVIANAVKRYGGKRTMQALGRISNQALVESVQEGGQQSLQNLIAREVYKPEQQILEGVVENAGIGGIVGGIAGLGREGVYALGTRRSGSARGDRARAVREVPPPSPEDEASPIPTADIVEGRERIADAEATENANKYLEVAGLPQIGQPVRIVRGRDAIEGVVSDAWEGDDPGVTVRAVDGTETDLSLAQMQAMGATLTGLPMPAPRAEIESKAQEIAADAEQVRQQLAAAEQGGGVEPGRRREIDRIMADARRDADRRWERGEGASAPAPAPAAPAPAPEALPRLTREQADEVTRLTRAGVPPGDAVRQVTLEPGGVPPGGPPLTREPGGVPEGGPPLDLSPGTVPPGGPAQDLSPGGVPAGDPAIREPMGPDRRPSVTGAAGRPEPDAGPPTRAVVVGPQGRVETGGPDSRPVVIGPSGFVESGGPDSRPLIVGPQGRVEPMGPDTRPLVIGPSGFVETGSGPEARPLVIGPDGRVETGGPDSRPVVVGPSGRLEAQGPETRPQVTGPQGRRAAAGPETRPVVIGPSGRMETSGPDSRPIVVGPDGFAEAMGPETRPVVVGPSGRLETTGPDSRPLIIGPAGRIEGLGPPTRAEVVGPAGRPEPDTGPQTRPRAGERERWLQQAVAEATGRDFNEARGLAEAVAGATGQDIDAARGLAEDVFRATGRDMDRSRALAQAISEATGQDVNRARALAQSVAAATGRDFDERRALAMAMAEATGADMNEARGIAEWIADASGTDMDMRRAIAQAVEEASGAEITERRALAEAVASATGRDISEARALAQDIARATGRDVDSRRALAEAIASADGRDIDARRALAQSIAEATGGDFNAARALAQDIARATGRDVNEQRALAEAVATATGRDFDEARALAPDVAAATGRDVDQHRALAESIAAATGQDFDQARGIAEDVSRLTGQDMNARRALAQAVEEASGTDITPRRALAEAIAAATGKDIDQARGLAQAVAQATGRDVDARRALAQAIAESSGRDIPRERAEALGADDRRQTLSFRALERAPTAVELAAAAEEAGLPPETAMQVGEQVRDALRAPEGTAPTPDMVSREVQATGLPADFGDRIAQLVAERQGMLPEPLPERQDEEARRTEPLPERAPAAAPRAEGLPADFGDRIAERVAAIPEIRTLPPAARERVVAQVRQLPEDFGQIPETAEPGRIPEGMAERVAERVAAIPEVQRLPPSARERLARTVERLPELQVPERALPERLPDRDTESREIPERREFRQPEERAVPTGLPEDFDERQEIARAAVEAARNVSLPEGARERLAARVEELIEPPDVDLGDAAVFDARVAERLRDIPEVRTLPSAERERFVAEVRGIPEDVRRRMEGRDAAPRPQVAGLPDDFAERIAARVEAIPEIQQLPEQRRMRLVEAVQGLPADFGQVPETAEPGAIPEGMAERISDRVAAIPEVQTLPPETRARVIEEARQLPEDFGRLPETAAEPEPLPPAQEREARRAPGLPEGFAERIAEKMAATPEARTLPVGFADRIAERVAAIPDVQGLDMMDLAERIAELPEVQGIPQDVRNRMAARAAVEVRRLPADFGQVPETAQPPEPLDLEPAAEARRVEGLVPRETPERALPERLPPDFGERIAERVARIPDIQALTPVARERVVEEVKRLPETFGRMPERAEAGRIPPDMSERIAERVAAIPEIERLSPERQERIAERVAAIPELQRLPERTTPEARTPARLPDDFEDRIAARVREARPLALVPVSDRARVVDAVMPEIRRLPEDFGQMPETAEPKSLPEDFTARIRQRVADIPETQQLPADFAERVAQAVAAIPDLKRIPPKSPAGVPPGEPAALPPALSPEVERAEGEVEVGRAAPPPPILRKDGSPFKTRQGAVLAARSKKIEAEPVEVEGGWALQQAAGAMPAEPSPTPPAEALVPEGAPQPDAPPVEAEPAAPVEMEGGLYRFDPATVTTDARAFQYKSGGDDAGVTERLQGIRTWDPVKAGIAIIYERADGTRVIADGHQRLGLAKRMVAEGQAPKLFGVLRREVDGWTEAEVRAEAALKNIAEGSGDAFDAATVLRDAPKTALDSLPPQSNLVRTAKDIARLEEGPFRAAKAAGLPAGTVGVVGRVAEGDGPLQQALIEEFADRPPPNVAQAESMARMFREDRTENEQVADLFGESAVARSFYRERARIIDGAIRRLRQDKRVFATLSRNAEQIQEAGNVLRADNEAIADAAGRGVFLVQQLATRTGDVSDAVKAAASDVDAGRSSRTQAIDTVVGAVRSWVDQGGSASFGLGRPAAPAEGDRQTAEDADREGAPDEVVVLPGQGAMFQRTDLPPGWALHRHSSGKYFADSAQWRTPRFDTEQEAIDAARKASDAGARLRQARQAVADAGFTGREATQRVIDIMEGRAEMPGTESDAGPTLAQGTLFQQPPADPEVARVEAELRRRQGTAEPAPPARVRIRLNRRYDEAREGVRGDLERIGRETFGKQFRFELAESITAPEGGQVPGAFDPANRVAYIALRADEAGMTGSLYHEGLHYLRNAAAFDSADGSPNAAWRTLERQAAQWRQDYGIDERYAGDVGAMDPAARERLLNEEAIAEALADYATRGRETGFGPTVRMALNRILRFFRAMREGLRGRGFQTWESVFEADIGRGRAGARADAAQAPSRAEVDRQLQTAWHGSPHRFDEFSTEAIGSGEGAQVYGFGLYFADKRGVADWYREGLTQGGRDVRFKALTDEQNHILAPLAWRLHEGGEVELEASIEVQQSAVRQFERVEGTDFAMPANLERQRAKLSALEALRGKTQDVEKPGATYRVDLAPKDSEYLYWDRRLDLQPKKVRNAMNAVWAREFPGETMNREESGGEAYRMLGRVLGSDRAASEALLAEGVRGVKYLDQSSRPMVGAMGRARVPLRETFNYVIFDDSDVAIQEIMLQRRRAGQGDLALDDDPRQMELAGTERLSEAGVSAARARDREQSEEMLVDVFGEDAVRRSDKLRSTKPQRGVEDLALFSGQRTLFQRGAKEDPKAFDKEASDWSGVDLTGAAEEVVKDKDRMGGFAEEVKAGLKGTTAIQDPNVKVTEEKTHKDLNLAWRFLAPPLAWSKKYPAIHSLIRQGVDTEKNMSNRIQRLNRDWDRITKPLSKDEFAQLTGIMFLGDAEQVTFTDEQLGRFNTTEKVRAAYKESRKFLDKIGRFTEQHERAMALPLLTRRTTLVRQMAGERGMDKAEFRELYNTRAELLGQQRRGAGDPRVIEFEIAEATESVYGGQEAPSELFLDRLKEADRLETRIADTKVRRREGYVPHKFFGRWRIFQAAQPDDEIEPYMGRGGTGFKDRKAAEKVAEASEGGILEGATPVQVDGKWGLEPKWKEVAGEHGLWKTRTDAVRAASHMAREGPDGAEIRVVPVEFEFPHDSATTLGDAAYFTFRSKVEELTGLSGEALQEFVTGVARRPFRRRIAGFLQYRTGMTGYSLDLDRVMRTHVGETVRYVSLDRLKFDAINTMEKEGLSAYRSSIQDRPVLAAAVQAWFRDVNGQKQTLESQIDNVLNKSWVTPLRAGLAAGALGFLAAGGPFNAPISPIVGAYVGYRVGRGLSQGGDFKTRAITGAMLGDMAHLKLGSFFNLMSALVNTSQVPLNTLPVLGVRDTAEGAIRYQKAVLSKLRGRPNADYRFLERMDINPLDTFAEGTRHKFKKESPLSKISMVFFSTAEGFNRGVTALGAMNKAQRKGWSHKRAKDFANETLDRTQFHYGASDKPELLRNVLLRVPLQFKNFVAHQLSFVFGLNRKELPLFLLSMALTAGALGIPGLDFVDTLTDWLFDFSPIAMMKEAALDAAVEGELEGGIATFLTRGVPGLAGVDMTGRVGMGDKFLPMQFRDWKGPWISTVENAVRHGREGASWQHQMRNLSPGLGNPLVVLDAWQNGGQVTSPWKRGRPEYRATPTELIQKLAGARPIREARLQDLRDIERRDIDRYRTDTRRYVDRIVAALDRGDRAAARAVMQEALDAGIPISSGTIRRGIQDYGTQRALREFDRLPRTMKPEGMGRREAIERMAQ